MLPPIDCDPVTTATDFDGSPVGRVLNLELGCRDALKWSRRIGYAGKPAMSCGRGIGIAGLPLLGIAGPSLRQGAAGTSYFEPGGACFWDKGTAPNQARPRWLSEHAPHIPWHRLR